MRIEPLPGSLAVMAVAVAAATSVPTHAAAQLVADAELKEACEVLRLGDALDVPEWLAFSGTPTLRLDLSGNLYLRAGQEPTVTVLDPGGGFVRYIGGAGEGPGEFTIVGNFAFVGDTLWLQDWPELHISFFDSAGAHIRTETDHGLPSSMPSLWRTSTPLARGYGFYIPPIRYAYSERGVVPDFKRIKLPMLVGIRSEASRDTLAFKYNYTPMIIEGIGTYGHQPIVAPPLYRIHPNGDGVVTVDWEPDHPEEVILRHYDVSGRVVRETSIGSRPRRVSDKERDAFIDEGVEIAERAVERARQYGGEVPSDLRAAVTEGLLLYDYFEPISSYFLTHDERVWLRDAVTPEGSEALWVVLGPDGAPAFRVLAPSGIAFKAALGDRVWGTGRTELDVPYIVLYELRQPGACG